MLLLQSGMDNITNDVIEGLNIANFKHLNVWTEILKDSFLTLFENGSLDFSTATLIRLTEASFQRVISNWDKFKKKKKNLLETSDRLRIICRLDVIAVNTPVEVDNCSHSISTNVSGSRVLKGLGGSADFLKNAKLFTMHCLSARPTRTDAPDISSNVPMAMWTKLIIIWTSLSQNRV